MRYTSPYIYASTAKEQLFSTRASSLLDEISYKARTL